MNLIHTGGRGLLALARRRWLLLALLGRHHVGVWGRSFFGLEID